jgi:hypothetical protein
MPPEGPPGVQPAAFRLADRQRRRLQLTVLDAHALLRATTYWWNSLVPSPDSHGESDHEEGLLNQPCFLEGDGMGKKHDDLRSKIWQNGV